MNVQPISKPGKLWAYMAVLVGGLLLLAGVAAALGYFGLTALMLGQDLLSAQLGQMAVIFLGLGCGALAVYHGLGAINSVASRPLRLPPLVAFSIAFAVMLGVGNLLLTFKLSITFLFPFFFLLGATLPTLGVWAWAARRLGWPLTVRQATLALVAGSTLSITIAIVLETVLPYLIYLLAAPLQSLAYDFPLGGADFFERLFFSPLLLLFLIITALTAPIPEEFAKALCLPLFGRVRLTTERQALLIGMASGAGFAILENMLYEGLYAQHNGWSWGGVTLLRGLGSVLHPLCAGLVALGWFRMKERGVGALIKAYALAVGLHTLWNGGFEAFVYLTGLDYYGGAGASLSLYGTTVEVLLAAYLLALSLALWWLLRRVTAQLAHGVEVDMAPAIISPSALAGWALACALVIVPIGAALGGAWPQIAAVLLAK